MERAKLASDLLDLVEPSLQDFCETAGKADAYDRLQTALYRYKQGTGRGVPEEDVQWIRVALRNYGQYS